MATEGDTVIDDLQCLSAKEAHTHFPLRRPQGTTHSTIIRDNTLAKFSNTQLCISWAKVCRGVTQPCCQLVKGRLSNMLAYAALQRVGGALAER